MAGIGHRGFMGRKKQVSPVPLSNLSFWYEFDNASKITEDGTNIQEIISNEVNGWAATPLVNDPVYSSANGYAQFTFGSSQALQSVQMEASGYPSNRNLITSGFYMMVIELDDLVNNRYIGGVSFSQAAPGSTSANLYGAFQGLTTGGYRIRYTGRMTSGTDTLLSILGTTVLTTGQKYLLQIYVPHAGGTYYEIDGVPQNNDVDGAKFCGILDPSTLGAYRWKADMGLIQSISPIYANSHKIFEFISYQEYDSTAYATVEAYLKTKYGIA